MEQVQPFGAGLYGATVSRHGRSGGDGIVAAHGPDPATATRVRGFHDAAGALVPLPGFDIESYPGLALAGGAELAAP
jgi:hypothetical protein